MRIANNHTNSITYVALTESYRLYVLRRRHSLYRAFLDGRLPPVFSFKDMVQHRFASLRCWLTGRYLNVTFEWREQTIYEFIFHQLVYRPLFGRVWWTGGLPEDEVARASALPLEEVNTALLKKHARKAITPVKVSPSSSETEEEWEKLEASRTGPLSGTKQQDSHRTEEDRISYTWLGQSTSLIQLSGVTILTDPVFAAQPLSSVFAPTRLRPPAISTDALLALDLLDLICISHNHYDHLDIDFVRAVVANEASLAHEQRVIWIVPLGVKTFLVKEGVAEAQVVDMDWWQDEVITVRQGKKLEVACTPAQHWSGRTPLDTNRSLWCGFVLREPDAQRNGGQSFFHAGDTGYSSDLYKAIGRIHGPITLAAIPIGSWEPRHFMKYVHTDPSGAVNVHRDLQVKKSVGVHHSTWIMSDEKFNEPVKELYRVIDSYPATGTNALRREEFVVLPPGQTILV